MNFAFPWPYSPGEWLAWSAAVCTILFGIAGLLAPRTALRALGIDAAEATSGTRGMVRAQIGGFYIGVGLSAILFAQPLLYLALGLAWALAALGWLLSAALDRGGIAGQIPGFFLALFLAILPLSFTFGLVP